MTRQRVWRVRRVAVRRRKLWQWLSARLRSIGQRGRISRKFRAEGGEKFEPGGRALNVSRARRGSGGADVSVGRSSNPNRTMGCWELRGHLCAVGENNKLSQMNHG